MPVMGMSPIVMPMFSKTEKARKAKAPAHARPAEAVTGGLGGSHDAQRDEPEQADHESRSDEAELLPDGREDEVRLLVGDVGQVRGGPRKGPVP